jgi:hypothetical protein
LGEAKKKISQGEGIIALYGSGDFSNLPPPEKTLFTNVVLAYFEDNINNTLYPVFVFEGLATTSSGELKIVVYLPALSTPEP